MHSAHGHCVGRHSTRPYGFLSYGLRLQFRQRAGEETGPSNPRSCSARLPDSSSLLLASSQSRLSHAGPVGEGRPFLGADKGQGIFPWKGLDLRFPGWELAKEVAHPSLVLPPHPTPTLPSPYELPAPGSASPAGESRAGGEAQTNSRRLSLASTQGLISLK